VLPVVTEAELARRLTERLPPPDVQRLAAAVGTGADAVRRLHAEAGGPLAAACQRALDLGVSPLLAGALLGAAAVRQHDQRRVDLVWSGPGSTVDTGRLTAAVLADLLDAAQRHVLLAGFAVHTEPRVRDALHAAAARGVDITLLLERPADNAHYSGPNHPFPDLPARRLAWPLRRRPPGASLHAKMLAVDDRYLLVGSANVTAAALDRNLECGLLLDGGREAEAARRHVEALTAAGDLIFV
jgi:cardiolipin synthase